MSQTLKITLGIEIALGLMWTVIAAMAHGPGGLGAVAFFFVIYAVFAAFFVFAAWAYWKRPEERKRAGWIMLLPVVFWFVPLIIRSMAGGFLSSQQLSIMLLALSVIALAACWVVPRKAAALVPDFLIRSKLFNWLVILAVIAGWLFFVGVIIYVVNEDVSGSSTSGTALAYALIIAATYLIFQGVGGFVVSTWAWLCLRGGFEKTTRGLNIAQLVVAAPGVLIAVTVAVWLAEQGRL